MNANKKTLTMMTLLATVVLAGLVALLGCEESEPAEPAQTKTVAAALETVQTTCPVMKGGAIDKKIFTEYKGKKVYFCCPECIDKFKAEPEKYIAQLPQFN